MIIKCLEISEIKLASLDSKNKTFDLEIKFSNDTTLFKKYELNSVKELPNLILNDIKNSKTPEMEFSNDILDTICSVNIKNDEEYLKECLLKFILRLDQRLKNFSRETEAKNYMKEFNSLSTYQEIVYKK